MNYLNGNLKIPDKMFKSIKIIIIKSKFHIWLNGIIQ